MPAFRGSGSVGVRRQYRSAGFGSASVLVEMATGIAYLVAVAWFPVARHQTLDPCRAVAEEVVLGAFRDRTDGTPMRAATLVADWLAPEIARLDLGSVGCYRALWADRLGLAPLPRLR
jgi:hypothetical protein